MIKKYLGIDYGTKRIGLAIGDSETRTAVVFGVISKIEEIVEVIKKESIDVIVVGKPYSIASKRHPMPAEFKKFVGVIHELPLPDNVKIVFEDERLSSKYADSLAGDKKIKAGRDEIAALSILQNFLDRKFLSTK